MVDPYIARENVLEDSWKLSLPMAASYTYLRCPHASNHTAKHFAIGWAVVLPVSGAPRCSLQHPTATDQQQVKSRPTAAELMQSDALPSVIGSNRGTTIHAGCVDDPISDALPRASGRVEVEGSVSVCKGGCCCENVVSRGSAGIWWAAVSCAAVAVAATASNGHHCAVLWQNKTGS